MKNLPTALLLLIFAGPLVFLTQCNQTPTEQTTQIGNYTKAGSIDQLNRYCIVCHTNLNIPEESLIAPPLEAVKRRYLQEYPNREPFIDHMSAFVQHPTEEKALMYGAVRRFQVMLLQPVDSITIRQIAAFIYDYKLDQPEWFESHYQQNHPEGTDALPGYKELFDQLDTQMDLHLNDGQKWAMAPAVYRQTRLLQEYVNGIKDENTLEDYPVLAQAIRSKLPTSSIGESESAKVFERFQSALETKIAYLEQSETKEQGEYALLQINKQLLLFDAYFIAQE